MNRAEKFRPILLISILCWTFALSVSAGEIMEEFESPELHPELWEIQAAGKASFEIKGGQLIMESPAVEDGILLRYLPEIAGEDITFEFKFDVSQGDASAQIWFADEPLAPDVNTDVNQHWILVQTIVGGNTYVKIAGDQKVVPDTPVKDGANVYKIVLQGNKATFFVNEKEMGAVDKPADVNYFHIGPDMYTSHYSNRIGILDYVRISGPNVRPLAVEPVSKLAATWAELKK